MKKLLLSTIALTGLLAASLRAGPAVEYKQVAPPPPPVYGLGFYGALDMGANVYQNRGENRTFTDNNPDSEFFGSNLEVDPKNDVGFYGGIKLGYVFGTPDWVIRPAVEGDFFYNGFRGGADFNLNEAFTPCPDCPTVLSNRQRNVTTWINTGAFMFNVILRIGPATWRFQPYAGAGVGIYYAESAGVEVTDPVTGRTPINTGGGRNHADLAWDVVAGSDYFFNSQWAAFIEYHYLDYTSTQIDTNQSRDLGQHLVGAGIRYFFH
ncbi:MAG TPA: outer membrane beta-barrel protein [Candidatus Udaeobacter sp.]|jgi:opacity protein-like surface antigen